MKSKNYDDFVEKFKVKKTTDDCYTPDEVYRCVLDYCEKTFDLKGKTIVRPFYPGGDYENHNYPDDCVVIDNPPFSCLSKIRRFYLKRNIPYFLFAPHLTILNEKIDDTAVLVGAAIRYNNGAEVRTSFVTNLENNYIVYNSPTLYQRLKEVQDDKKKFPKYNYPIEVMTVSDIQKYTQKGICFFVDKKEAVIIGRLDHQKEMNKKMFGSGMLLSKKATNRRIYADKKLKSAIKLKSEIDPKYENVIKFNLSEREIKLINKLK